MLSSLSTKTLVQNKVAQADPQGKLARKKKVERKTSWDWERMLGDLPRRVGNRTRLL